VCKSFDLKTKGSSSLVSLHPGNSLLGVSFLPVPCTGRRHMISLYQGPSLGACSRAWEEERSKE